MSRPIGSSSVGAVLGLSPYATPADVQSRLLGGPGHGAGWAAELGNLLEPALRLELARRLDVEIIPGPPYGADPWKVAENQISHPDGEIRSGGVILTEIKTGSSWDGWTESRPRPDYEAQVRHQMEAHHPDGLEVVGAYVYALHVETGERRLYRLDRDGRGARIVGRIGDWYARHVIEAAPCPPVGLPAYVPAGRAPRRYVAPEGAIEAVAALRSARDAADAAEANVAAARARVIELVGDADGLVVDGVTLATYHAGNPPQRWDSKALDRLLNERPDLAPLLRACRAKAPDVAPRTLLIKEK